MNNIAIFQNPDFGQIRTLQINNEPWFVGKDVAEALGYSNSRKALADHVDNDDKNTVTIRDGIPGNPNLVVINESGLYALIFGSKLESAKKFKRWVTSEVLPTLRKTGHYEMPGHSAVNIDDVMDTVQFYEKLESRGKSPEEIAQIISGVYARRYGSSEKILPPAGPKKKSLPEHTISDEEYHEYAEQVKALGFPRKNGILIFPEDFKNFCTKNKISDRKFRKWLYRNGCIKGSISGSGKLNYTVHAWHDGETKRFIIFT